MRAFLIGLSGFLLSIGNALVALPKGEEFLMTDIMLLPLVCVVLAVGNGILSGLGMQKKEKL